MDFIYIDVVNAKRLTSLYLSLAGCWTQICLKTGCWCDHRPSVIALFKKKITPTKFEKLCILIAALHFK